MDDAAGDLISGRGPAGDGGVEGVDRESGFHSRVDGVADDPVRVHVLDRAQVELALTGVMLGDICEPQSIPLIGGEVAGDEVVVDRRPGTDVFGAAFLAERAPPLVG